MTQKVFSDTDIFTVNQLKLQEGRNFVKLCNDLETVLATRQFPELHGHIKSIFESKVTNHDMRWILGMQNSIEELRTRKYLCSHFILRILIQHPHYLYKVSVPEYLMPLDNFFDYIARFIKLRASIKSQLLGYSTSYVIPNYTLKMPLPLRQLLTLYRFELNEFGEFGLISLLCRVRLENGMRKRNCRSLDSHIERSNNFSPEGKRLLHQFYFPLVEEFPDP